MRETIYKCDSCQKVLSQDSINTAVPHLFIETRKVGYAHKPRNGWETTLLDKAPVLQFCNGTCAKEFFDKAVVEAKLEIDVRGQLAKTNQALGGNDGDIDRFISGIQPKGWTRHPDGRYTNDEAMAKHRRQMQDDFGDDL